jgi:hypothetical protein
MKYNIAMIVLVLFGAAYLAGGYIKSNRDKQNVLLTRATVSAMSPQRLARGIADCDPVRQVSDHPKNKSTLCTEINRALDQQRLQLVEERPMVMPLPLSLPPLRLRKAGIAPLSPPDDLGGRVELFDLAKTG